MGEELVSKKLAKQINGIVALKTQSAKEAGSIGFTTKNLVIANLPYKDPKTDRWTRTNGNYTFTVVALREGGKIPFGVIPRLFFIWLITEIVRIHEKETKLGQPPSKEIILGRYFNDFMENIGCKEDGGYTRARVKDQLLRLFSVAIGAYYDDKNISSGVPPESFVKEYSLWVTDKKNDTQQELFPAKLVVKDSFYDEIIKIKVPIDMRVVELLSGSAFKLDIYIWLTYKMYNVKTPLMFKYEDLMTQFGDDADPSDKKALDNFRTRFRSGLKVVLKYYPANVDVKKYTKQIILYPSPTSVAKKQLS